MKGKNFLILLVAALVLGAAWYFLAQNNQSTWSQGRKAGGDKVLEFPINDVARVEIKSATGDLNLVRKDEIWTVQERANYPASFEQIATLLRKLYDLKTVQEVKVGPSQMPRLELVEPGKGDSAGTLVQFYGADGKPLPSLLVGKKQMRKSEGGEDDQFGGANAGFATGRYVKPVAGTKVSLVSDPLDDVDPKPERWLAKDFIKVESPKSIAVSGPTDAQKWTVTRETATGEWKLADAKPDEKLDTGKISGLNSIFSSAGFNDVQAPGTKLEEPVTTATIETFDGFKYDLKIGKAIGENHQVTLTVTGNFPKERTPGKDEKPEDKKRLDDEFAAKQKQNEEKLANEKKLEGRPYLLAKFSVEALLKDRSALLADKPAEPVKPTEPALPGTPPPAPAPPAPKPPAAPAPAAAPATPAAPDPAPEPVKPAETTPQPQPPKPEEAAKPTEAPKPTEPPTPTEAPKPPEPAPTAPPKEPEAPKPAAPEAAPKP